MTIEKAPAHEDASAPLPDLLEALKATSDRQAELLLEHAALVRSSFQLQRQIVASLLELQLQDPEEDAPGTPEPFAAQNVPRPL